jgi:hypothetical protein
MREAEPMHYFYKHALLKLKFSLVVFLQGHAYCTMCVYKHWKNKEIERDKQERCVLTLDVEHNSVGVFCAQLVFGDALVLSLVHLLAVTNLQTPCNKYIDECD